MSVEDPDHLEMMGLVREEKYQQERLAKAETLLEQWRPRLKLAKEKGREDLVAEATRRLEAAARERGAARHAIERVQMQKDMLRKQVKRDNMKTANEAYSESLLDGFRNLGVDPEAVQINDAARDMAGDDALAALKAKMRSGES